MDLWIRSQDKERLGKIVYLELKNDDYGFHIIGWKDKFEGTKIATYKTKERALEVLDEIQKYIADSFSRQEAEQFFGGFGTTRKSKIVYEMPEE